MARRHYPDPFRPVEPGLEVVVTRWLIPAYLAGVGLPALGALLVHGLEPARDHVLAQALAFSLAAFDSTMVFSAALACLIVTLMKGRPRQADPMPPPED